MKKKILWLGLSFLLVAALVLTACPATTVEEPVVEEPVVEEPVGEEPVVEEPVVEEPVVEEPVVRPLLLEGQGLAPVTDETIVFQGWTYHTEVVESNVNRYNTEMGGNVAYATITGDYPMLMEMKLVAGEALDLVYAGPGMAVRYYEGGWILPAEELPNIDAIKADMYPAVRDMFSYKGKLLGLSYFMSTLGIVFVNLKAYNGLGFTEADYPKTWTELYDQLFEFKALGWDTPFLPHWYSEWFGIGWGFMWEVLNRGGYTADPDTHAPMITVDGVAGDTLRDWKRAFNAGLIPAESLGYRQPEFLEAWASGEYVYSQHASYDMERYNNPVYNAAFAGYNSFLPYQGQAWGFLEGAMYVMSNRPRSPELNDDVMRFFSWYGWKDHEGETYVGQNWMNETLLFSAYKSVMESPESAERIKAALSDPANYDAFLEVYANATFEKGCRGVVWAPEFDAWLMEKLHKYLLEDLPVDETIEAIRTKINELNAFYGVS